MPAIIVDKEKCKMDKLCVMECPMKIISVDDSGIPQTLNTAESMCIECGHCVAVCPHGALSLPMLRAEECQDIHYQWNPGVTVIENYFKSRRSIRRFKKDIVKKEDLMKLLEITAYAPTGHNSRTVEYIVYTQKEEIHALVKHVIDWMHTIIINSPEMAKSMHFDMITKAWEDGIDTVTHSAPVIIVAHGKKIQSKYSNIMHYSPYAFRINCPGIRAWLLLGRILFMVRNGISSLKESFTNPRW